ncbi:hypothetical protein [Streptomyces sp. NPDC058644]|uniref:hypothetical protein n=1 Tax=unclassified Streptomyces TaxID=2593676 RepID=UPI0036605543
MNTHGHHDERIEERGKHPADLCDLCGTELAGQSGRLLVVADSSAVQEHAPRRDGQRLVVACSPAHLTLLEEVYRRRAFIDEELWAGQIARTLRQHAGKLTPEMLQEKTGLTPHQLVQAINWSNSTSWCAGSPSKTDGRGPLRSEVETGGGVVQ